jgi:hypothetical protein
MRVRIQNGIIVEILQPISGFAIEDCFHPDLLLNTVDTTSDVVIGSPWPPETQPESQP